MKKKITMFISLIVIVMGVIYFIDDYFDFGIRDWIELKFDKEGPIIQTEHLFNQYLINQDYELSFECRDNLDDTCLVFFQDDFKTNKLGKHSIALYTIDRAGNRTEYTYIYIVVDEVDGSIYIPSGYFNDIDGLSGESLKEHLHNIIKNHVEYPYTSTSIDLWDILREADEDPNNANNVLGFYTIPKDC